MKTWDEFLKTRSATRSQGGRLTLLSASEYDAIQADAFHEGMAHAAQIVRSIAENAITQADGNKYYRIVESIKAAMGDKQE